MTPPVGNPDPVRLSAVTLSGYGGGGVDLLIPDGTTSLLAGEGSVFNSTTGGGRVGLLFTSKDASSFTQEIVVGYRHMSSKQPGVDPAKLFQRLGLDPDKQISITDFFDLDQIPEPYRTQIENGSTPITLRELLTAGGLAETASAKYSYHTGEILWRIYVGGFAIGSVFALQPRIAAGLAFGSYKVTYTLGNKDTTTTDKFVPAVRLEGGVLAMFHLHKSYSLGLSANIVANLGLPTYLGGDLAAEMAFRF
jgi:hypothetical protein